MGWFDEQIRRRRSTDQKKFEESLFRMVSAAAEDEPLSYAEEKDPAAKTAVDEIMDYFLRGHRERQEDAPADKKKPEAFPYARGIMHRRVMLEDEWYRDAFGPMLVYRKADHAPVVLLPGPFGGYHFQDPVSGKKTRIDRGSAAQFEEEAVCFYRPLPLKELGIPDLIVFLKDCLNAGDYLFLFFLSLGVTLCGMLMTNITHALTGYVLESADTALLAGAAAFMISVIIASRLIAAARQLMMARIQTKTSVPVEAAVMMRIIDLPAGFFRNYASGELASRYNALRGICELMLGNVLSLGLGAILSLLYITQIFHYAPALVIPAFLVILAGTVISWFTGCAQRRQQRMIMEKSAKETGLSYALITGIQKIRLAGAEKRAFAKWGDAYAEVSRLSWNPPVLVRENTAIMGAVSLAGTIALFYMAVKTSVTASEYIAFSTAYGAVTAAFASLTGAVLSVAGVRPMLEMVEPILRTETESSEERNMVRELSGNIEISGLSFRYSPNKPFVISDLDLKIRAGEYIAIVGRTGCGKSTIIRLLLGFETAEKGTVYYDGQDIRNLDLHSLRRHIGTVMQDGSLFQGDIYSNIAVSAPQLSMEEAWQAAETAGIADDIRAMPMGMQTLISEGQGGVSGGQKQRLMIARAVASKPKILIFDEATSALDNRTQKQVSEALDRLHCTRIVIAHRLSTVRHCDRIVVLDRGRIAEEGTYEELIAGNGLFAELMARQRTEG